MELSLLKPQVLNGVLRAIPVPENHLGSRMFKRRGYPFPVVSYDTVAGSRTVAQPNMPGAPANIVAQHGLGHVSYGMLYTREKKVFDAVTMYWLRAIGTINEAKKYAEENVKRELEDLNSRNERFVEAVIWQALTTGRIVLNTPQVKANIDLKFLPDSFITKQTDTWDNPDAPIVADIEDYKRRFIRLANVPAQKAFATSRTLSLFARNTEIRSLMSETQRATYLTQGTIPGLLGIDWVAYDGSYETENGDVRQYIPDGHIVFVSEANNAFELLEGPSADTAAQGAIGKFTKTWEDQDPSAIQALVEYTFGPAIYRPAQVMNVTVAPADFT